MDWCPGRIYFSLSILPLTFLKTRIRTHIQILFKIRIRISECKSELLAKKNPHWATITKGFCSVNWREMLSRYRSVMNSGREACKLLSIQISFMTIYASYKWIKYDKRFLFCELKRDALTLPKYAFKARSM